MCILKYDPIISYYFVEMHTNKSYSLDMTKYYRGDDGISRTGFDQDTAINCNRREAPLMKLNKISGTFGWMGNHDIT